jgi:hypothetical protein
MIFASMINWSIYLFLVYQYLKNKFPEQTQNFAINASYYLIYVFSKIQIALNKNEKCREYISKFIELKENITIKAVYLVNKYYFDNSVTTNIPENEILFKFILNDKTDISFYKDELIEYIETSDFNETELIPLDSYDLILVIDNNNNIKILNKEDLNLKNLKTENCDIFKIKPVDYKPILCEFKFGSMNLKIDFQNRDGDYNYLVMDNKIDIIFLKYFLKNHYKYNIEEFIKDDYDFDYELKILDQNVENISINKKDILKIEEQKMVKL